MLPQTVAILFFLLFVAMLHAHPAKEESLVDKQARSGFAKDWLESTKTIKFTATEFEKLMANLKNATQKYVKGVQLFIGECLNKQESALHAMGLYRIVEGELEYTETDPCDNTVRFKHRLTKANEHEGLILVNGVVYIPVNDGDSAKPKSFKGGDLCALTDTVFYSVPLMKLEILGTEIFSGVQFFN